MADKVPIRAAYSGANALTGLATFATSETIGVAHGGTGLAAVGTNQLLTGNNSSTTGALTSESNLTFDGTILKSTGDLCATVKVVSPALCIGSEYVLPTADGSAGQIMCTDGSGALAFATASAGVTLAGSTNNTIATVTGTDALCGEANLTFDGSTLSVAGAALVNSGSTRVIAEFTSTDTNGMIVVSADTETLNDTAGIAFNATASSALGSTHSIGNIEGKVVQAGTLKGDLVFHTNSGDSLTEKMRIDNAGDVGIGTSAPSGWLANSNARVLAIHNTDTTDGNSATELALSVAHSTSWNAISFTNGAKASSSAEGKILYDHNSNSMRFSTNASEHMRIASDGDIGIGTTAPDVQLHLEQGTDTTTGTLPSARFERTGASQTGVVLRSNGIDGLILRADSAGFGAIHSYEDLGFYTGATPGSSYGNVRMRIETTSANTQGTGVTFVDCCANYVVIGGLPATGSKGMAFQWENGSDQGIINGIHTGSAWKPISISQNANLCLNSGSGYTAFGADYGRIVTCTESGGDCSRFIINVCADSATAPMAFFHVRGMCMSGCFCIPYCICANTCIGSPTKNFEIEHPLASDESPNKYNMMHLVHSTLEGPEYGVYYRGSAQLNSGAVKVDLPEYFEALAEKTDATVQLTPVGGISNLTIKLDEENIFTNNSFCVCTDDEGSQTQCFHWIVNGRRIDKHILCTIAQGDRPGACDDGRLCVTRWEYRGEMDNLNGIDTMTCAELDDFINFNNTWDNDDPDFVTDYETVSKANKIIMIGNAFDAIQNSAEGGKEDFSEEEEE